MHKNQLAYMTWPQVKEAAERDVPVLIPLGTTETQGPHAPMGHDYIVAERLAWAVAEKQDCIVTPAVPFGYSFFAKPYPGTISLEPETLRHLLRDLSESLIKYGFRHLIFINNHGLNEPILAHVANALRERHGINAASIFPSKVAQDLSGDLYQTQAGVFAHGGEPTISLMMYLTPDAMHMDDAKARTHPPKWNGLEVVNSGNVRVGKSTVGVYMPFTDLFPEGGSGDPTQATAEKGRIMFERMVEFISDFCTQFRQVKM